MRQFPEGLLAILKSKAADKETEAARVALSRLVPTLVATIEEDVLDGRSKQVDRSGELSCLLDDLHCLMAEPAWMEAHLAEDGHHGNFLSEVQAVWRVANKAGELAQQTQSNVIPFQVRCALLQTSMNSLASSILPEMLSAGIRMGKWSVEASLAYAKQQTHAPTKVTMLADIAVWLFKQRKDDGAQQVLTDALMSLRDIDSSSEFVNALIALLPYLPPNLLRRAFFLAQEIPNSSDRVRVFAELLPRLSLELQDEVVVLVEELSSPEGALAIAGLARHLPEASLSPALNMVRAATLYPMAQAKVLVALSTRLPTQLLPDALAIAEAIDSQLYRTACLMAFPGYGTLQQRSDMVRQSLITPWASIDVMDRAAAISLLAPNLPRELLPELFPLVINLGAGEIAGGSPWAKAMQALGPHLPSELQAQLIDILRKSHSILFTVDILSSLVEHLPQELLATALTAARELIQEAYAEQHLPHFEPGFLPNALIKIFPRLQEMPNLIPEVFTTIRAIRDTDARCLALTKLVPYLPKPFLPEALELARWVTEPRWVIYHALPLVALSEHGLPAAFQEAMRVIPRAQYGDQSVVVLPVLLASAASYPTTQKLVFWTEANAAAKNVTNPVYRSQALVEIANWLPESREELLDEAYDTIEEISSPYEKSMAIARLIPSLPHAARTIATNRLLKLAKVSLPEYGGDNPAFEEKLRSLFTPFLLGGQTEGLLTKGQLRLTREQITSLMAAMKDFGARERLLALEHMASHLEQMELPDAQRRIIAIEVLEAVENSELPDRYPLGASLAKLLPLFPSDLYSAALALARKIQSPHALAALVRYASGQEHQQILDEALTVSGIRSGGERVNIPVTLVPYLMPYLPDQQQQTVLERAMTELQQIPVPANWTYFRNLLRPIVKAWAQLPRQQAYRLWIRTLQEYGWYRQEYFLVALSELLPVIHALGGSTAVIETMNAVLDVCRKRSWELREALPS